jgi:hypothetical protein
LDTGRFVVFAASHSEAFSGVIVCTLLRTQTTSAVSSPDQPAVVAADPP